MCYSTLGKPAKLTDGYVLGNRLIQIIHNIIYRLSHFFSTFRCLLLALNCCFFSFFICLKHIDHILEMLSK